MAALDVALVSKDPAVRLAAVMALEEASGYSLSLHEEPPAGAHLVMWGSDMPQQGRLVFDPADPGACLAALDAATGPAGSARVIAVRSASGGAGCTTIALHLAARLSQQQRACVIELDPRGGMTARLGLDPERKTWADSGADAEDLMLAALPVTGGFRVLVAPGDGTGMPPDLIRRAGGSFDVLILDGGRLPIPCTCWAHLLVVPPTKPGCVLARGVLEDTSVRWGTIINRTGSGGSLTRSGAEKLLGRRALAELPCTPSLRDAEDDYRLLEGPWTRWSRRVGTVAGAVTKS